MINFNELIQIKDKYNITISGQIPLIVKLLLYTIICIFIDVRGS